jgi:beta-glucanase (GH16 family)
MASTLREARSSAASQACAGSPCSSSPGSAHVREWSLLWSDEFDGPAGAPADPASWQPETGGNGWGNDELQCYTDGENVSLDGRGNLAIAVRRAEPLLHGCAFTSARLITKRRVSFTYGLVEVRMRLAAGRGIWPAVWMLGEDIDEMGWPLCGEIDVMEHFGTGSPVIHGTVHGPGYSGTEGISARRDAGLSLADDFHVYSVDWEPERIRWYLDGELYGTVMPGDLGGNAWVFDKDFFLLVNVAVGGALSEAPDSSAPFPQTVLIDYVRVSARTSP